MTRSLLLLTSIAAIGCGGKAVGSGDGIVTADEVPQVGWEAELIGSHHDVGGTAVIVDEATIEIRDFTYDGGGVNAHIFLLADGEEFHDSWELTDNLVGVAFDGETLELEIPEDAPFDAWNLITVWCVPFAASFGDGVFEPGE
jgi:hypothetical protein